MGIRVEGDTVGLTSSLKTNGDVEVFFGQSELDALIDALSKARKLLA